MKVSTAAVTGVGETLSVAHRSIEASTFETIQRRSSAVLSCWNSAIDVQQAQPAPGTGFRNFSQGRS